MSTPNVEANRQQQINLYGAPIGDLAHSIMAAVGLSQRELAKVLGLSAPMLSQLISGQRIKVSNPIVVARLQELLLLRDRAEGLSPDQLEACLSSIGQSQVTLTGTTMRSGEDARSTAVDILASVGGAGALEVAAAALPADHPLAALLLEAADRGTADG